MNKKYLELTTLVAFIAIIMLMTLIPQLGYITLMPGVSLTLIHIPFLIGIYILPNKKAWILGIVWGLSSLIASYLYANTPFDIAFQNPFISVVPKIIFGFIAIGIKKLISIINEKFKNYDYILFTIISIITILFVYYGTTNLAKNISSIKLEVIMPISLIILGLLLGFYFYSFKKSSDEALISFYAIILTMIHTFLVLFWVMLFAKDKMIEAFNSTELINAIMGVAGFNGLIESSLASIIVPLIIKAIKSSKLQINNY